MRGQLTEVKSSLKLYPFLYSFKQINNSTRVEETGYGFKLDILRYEEQELFEKLKRILEDTEIRRRWKAAGERIRAENRTSLVVNQIVDHVCRTKGAALPGNHKTDKK